MHQRVAQFISPLIPAELPYSGRAKQCEKRCTNGKQNRGHQQQQREAWDWLTMQVLKHNFCATCEWSTPRCFIGSPGTNDIDLPIKKIEKVIQERNCD